MILHALRYVLFPTILAWMNALAPGVDHEALAWAVASEAGSLEDAAVFTAVAFRESSFDNGAVGDHGRSVCAFQIHGGDRALLTDVGECTRVGAKMLRASKLVDPKNPIASYARGPNWKGKEAQRISGDRMALAKRLLGAVP